MGKYPFKYPTKRLPIAKKPRSRLKNSRGRVIKYTLAKPKKKVVKPLKFIRPLGGL